MAALDPALGVLSALTSLPAALYYARAFGAAAVRPVRDAGGRISGLRGDARWTRTLFLFLGGTLLVAAVLGGLNMAFAQAVSQHAAFGAMLVALLWPHARENAVRVLLVLLLIAAGASRLLLGTEALVSVGAGYAIGLACAWTVRYAGRTSFGRRR